jgi:hypothetical protein
MLRPSIVDHPARGDPDGHGIGVGVVILKVLVIH